MSSPHLKAVIFDVCTMYVPDNAEANSAACGAASLLTESLVDWRRRPLQPVHCNC
jgi:hypothetical protein